MCCFIKKLFTKECSKDNRPFMTLEHFITESLVQICDGIRTAQNKITANEIKEKSYSPSIAPYSKGGKKEDIYEIKFDVTVTTINATSTTNSNATNTGINTKPEIFVVQGNVNFESNSQKAANQSTSSLNRIQFTIPIIYPSMP